MRISVCKMAVEPELPIDIHYNKLLDWLIDRRHCDVKWATQFRGLREKTQASLPHLPPAQRSALGEQPSPNYFQCLGILEVLKTADGDSKSLFGKYLSPRVQEWAEIVREFERGGVYLADCAQRLTRNVNYEIPALKQGLARSQQVQQDSLKREQEARSSAASLRAKFQQLCEEMGIKGQKVREELKNLFSELPDIFQQTIGGLSSLSPALNFYRSTIEHNTGRPVELPQFLPMLHYLSENGNVTVYQWKHGTEPEVEEESQTPAATEQAEVEADIDWGLLSEPAQSDGAETIDWEDVGTLTDIVVVEEKEEGGTTREEGNSATSLGELETLLASRETRNLFLDDLMELKEFLSWRLREMTRTDDILSGQFGSEGAELKLHGVEGVQKMLDCVLSVLDPLTSTRTENLLLMKSSAHFLDRMAASLQSPQLLANKAQAQAELAASRREEAVAMALNLQPQLEALVSDTRTLQKQVEQQISRLYKGREVNIIGEINVTLQLPH